MQACHRHATHGQENSDDKQRFRQAAMQRLTPAERLVAAMAAEGLPYKSIARELGKSPATVRNQLHAIYQKLDVGNRTALAHKLRGQP